MDDPAFVAGIVENKLDRTARLVYADWLDEHGEYERAERIRARVAEEETATTPRPCPNCNGVGGKQLDAKRIIRVYGTLRSRTEPCKVWTDCGRCKGCGKVVDKRKKEWGNPLWLLGHSDEMVREAELKERKERIERWTIRVEQ